MPLRQQSNALADCLRWLDEINTQPTTASGIRTHHGVPFRRIFRQWDTNGRLWLWANPGLIAEIPKARTDPKYVAGIMNPWFGIPVYSDQGGTL